MAVSTTLDLTAGNAILKELYDDQVVRIMTARDAPLLALLPKETDFVGKVYPVPIVIGNSQGRSANFTRAKANQTALDARSFMLTRRRDYAIATIANEMIEAAELDKGAFVKGTKILVDAAIKEITASLCTALYRSGTGSVGRIASITTGVITFVDSNSAMAFAVNATVQANATDGGASPRAAVGYVIAVDYDAGTITVASSALGGAAATPTGWVANDYLLVDGDNNEKLHGLAGWFPLTAPTTGDNWFTVDRSANPTLLAGVRHNGSGQSIEEALVDAVAKSARFGGRPTAAATNFVSWGALEKSLGAKVQYVDLKGPGEIMFRGIRINGPKGPIDVVPDPWCPGQIAYLLDFTTCKLKSLGDAPHILTYGISGDMMRVADADAAEVRVAYYANFYCDAPGYNAVVSLSA